MVPCIDLPTMEEAKKQKEIDYYEKLEAVEQAFKLIFGEAIHIITKKIRVGGTSNTIYVPKQFEGNAVTIIIWPKPNANE